MTSSFRETPAFHRGQLAERQVAQILRDRGWYVIPSADYCGPAGDEHAPAAMSDADRLILPDLDIARRGQRSWAEVKGKSRSTFTRVHASADQGIGLRHYFAYRRMQDEYGCFVFIFIVEFSTQMV